MRRCAEKRHGSIITPRTPDFGDVWYVDGHAAATGEIVLELIEKLKVALTQDMAQWLYIAISTDCGQFRLFQHPAGDDCAAAAKLMETGIDVSRLVREAVSHPLPGRATQLLGAVLARLHVSVRTGKSHGRS